MIAGHGGGARSGMERITLGYLDPFRPFCWSEGGRARGRFIDALRERVADPLALDFLPGTLDDLPRWLAEERIDGIAAKAVTPERGAAFAFSEPLLETAAALFAPEGSAPPLPAALAPGARIATPAGGPLVALLARLAPGAQVLPVADYAAAFAAVLENRADVAALNADAGDALRPAGIGAPGPRFAPLGLAVAVAAEDPKRVLARLGLGAFSAGG
jgi:ABC-type amino acid transport substrate-binding protein